MSFTWRGDDEDWLILRLGWIVLDQKLCELSLGDVIGSQIAERVFSNI